MNLRLIGLYTGSAILATVWLLVFQRDQPARHCRGVTGDNVILSFICNLKWKCLCVSVDVLLSNDHAERYNPVSCLSCLD